MLAVFRSLLLKLDRSVLLREQGVITTHANIDSRMEVSAALAHDDIAGNGFLPTVQFDAQSLTLGIATVLGTAACFFVSHCIIPFVSRSRA